MQHVIATAVLPYPLHGDHGLGIRHHADHTVIAGLVVTHVAKLAVGEILTDGAQVDLFLGIHNGASELCGLLLGHIQHRKSHAEGAFPPYTAQLAKLLCQVLQRFDVFGHIRTDRAYS